MLPFLNADSVFGEVENDENLLPNLAQSVAEIEVPDISSISLSATEEQPRDIFAPTTFAKWSSKGEARCDFQYRLKLSRHEVCFVHVWSRSVKGRTLTEIKADPDMIPRFVDTLTPVISDVLGLFLDNGDWALVTTPKRRHKVQNFASLVAERIARNLGIPFYDDCATCRSRHRTGAVFDANNIPREQNVIVFDDFVTTGSTFLSMQNLLQKEGKNMVFFAGIHNRT